MIDREQVADLGLDLAASARNSARLLGGSYVNRFNFYDRSYKVIPQIGDADRATPDAAARLKVQTPDGGWSPSRRSRSIETRRAPRTLNRFQQRNSLQDLRRRESGVTKDEALTRAGDEGRGRSCRPGYSHRLRRRSRARSGTKARARRSRSASPLVLIYLVLAAQFSSFRDPLIVLLGSVPLAISGALLFSFLGPHDDQHLLAGRADHARRPDRQERHPDRPVCQHAAGAGPDRSWTRHREAALTRLRPVLMTSAATVFGHLPLVFVTGAGAAARNSIGIMLVAGMIDRHGVHALRRAVDLRPSRKDA